MRDNPRFVPRKALKHKAATKHKVRHNSPLSIIAEKLKEHATNEQVDANSPRALLLLIADVFHAAGKQEGKEE